MKGKRMTVSDVIRELQKEENLFRRSGGGITLSGGEPLAQPVFARELLKACKAKGWHTAMETTGMTSKAVIEDVFPWVDLALTDIKAVNPTIHQLNTGVDNRTILENLIRISFITHVIVRIPVIPGVNDSPEEIRSIAEFARLMSGVDTIHLLPYHTFGENKYTLLGRIYPMGDAGEWPEPSAHSEAQPLRAPARPAPGRAPPPAIPAMQRPGSLRTPDRKRSARET